MKKRWSLILSILSMLATVASGQTITVGSKKFTESFVLGEIAKGLLDKTGISATHKQGMGATIILWQALKQGSIDVYPEYTGTIGEEILKSKAKLSESQMRAELAKSGIGMSPQLGFNNTYALVMKRQRSQQLHITKISDLRAHPELVCGPTIEFLGRKDGWKPLAERYGLALSNVKGIEHMLGYQALESGSIDLKDAYSTDAAIAEKGLVVLEDDLGFFPQYKAVYLFRLEVPRKAVEQLDSLAGKIDENRMIALNAEAERTKDYAAAANSFLRSLGQKMKSPAERSVLLEMLGYTAQHLELVGISLFIAILVGVPLGIWAAKPGWVGSVILSLTGLVQTIPSLALFAILVPFMGTEPRTAILALFLYSLLPIVRNTAAGLSNIAPSLKESARAIGLEPRARLLKVELPLASPTMLAGIKTSAIINVGTATIAAFIGAGGLGQPIQTGLALSDNALILRGGIAAAILALLVQGLFELVERFAVPKGLRL